MPAKKLVVVIDDDVPNRELLSYRLIREGYRVYCPVPQSGFVFETLDHGPPDAIILDIHLDRISGLGLLRDLKKDARLERTKVVILANERRPEDRRQCLDLGAHLYLTKPYSVRELLEQLDRLLTTSATS